jgi:hypothetical protein
MRKFMALVASAFAVAALAFAPAAFADSPHYVKGPTATVQGNSLVVSWKAAGLGEHDHVGGLQSHGHRHHDVSVFHQERQPGERRSEVGDNRRQRDGDVPGAQRADNWLVHHIAAVDAHVYGQPARCHPVRFL